MKLKKITALALSGAILAGAALTGCGSSLDSDAAVAFVNGKEISLGLANCLAQFTAVTYDTYYMPYYGQDMWTADSTGSGTTMTDTVKNNTLEQLEEYYLLEEHMSEYGIEITAEETAKIEEAAAQFLADNTPEALEAMGATEDYIKEMLRLGTLQKKMRDAIVVDADTNVPDEECAQKTFSYVRVSKTAAASSDSEETEEKTDEQKAAEAKEKAQKILTAALTGSQDDPLKAAAEDNDANMSTCAYGSADLSEEENSTYLELEVLQAAEKLDEGEFAKNLLETDSYYYIIRMDSLFDEEATENERKSIISEREQTLYDETVDAYKEAADWTINDDVWAPVNFDTIYTKAQTQTDTADDADDAAEDSEEDSSANTDTTDETAE